MAYYHSSMEEIMLKEPIAWVEHMINSIYHTHKIKFTATLDFKDIYVEDDSDNKVHIGVKVCSGIITVINIELSNNGIEDTEPLSLSYSSDRDSLDTMSDNILDYLVDFFWDHSLIYENSNSI